MTFRLLFLFFFFISNCFAYSLLDEASIKLDLEKGWKSTGIKRDQGSTTVTYVKEKKGKVDESFAQIQMPREKGKTVNEEINEMTARMDADFKKNKCKTGGMAIMPQSSNKYNAWNEVIECPKDKVNIMLFFVNADAKYIYLFIYTNSKRPFTTEVQEASLKSIKETIKICYRAGDCYQLE